MKFPSTRNSEFHEGHTLNQENYTLNMHTDTTHIHSIQNIHFFNGHKVHSNVVPTRILSGFGRSAELELR